ncbi:MAG: phenylalanine--tRNA ligase beta subunit-related protein [Clostridia bacterium]|nr:phenylalanine--tRNA ligase beta subunit-related protein [Clostridia bacterium]
MISIDSELKELYPDIKLGCLVYEADVKETNPELWKKIDNEVAPSLIKTMETTPVTEIENIGYSRKAYKALGKDPGRYRVSSEALYRRIKQGKGLYKINTVVDVNNLISLETGFSVGSYDLDCVNGEIVLCHAKENESYKGIGKDTINIASLPVLRDDDGPFGSPTSDSTKAMIGLETKRVITIIYDFSPNADLDGILKKSSEYLAQYAGAKNIETFIV